ncbi:MAG: VWA domain-containing protein [Acidobacteria bacterium]|uniref:VWA domain-containing protein n=1 Tax=Candidatus Polarisedimenticola svalbardensis TaxID=2886004 RepID=A0A8J6Y294_9BACT|nr:VWA domain-containing protein [Candidatus Polarisedimenticola svalbardensis]
MIRTEFLNSQVHRYLDRLAWAWLLAVPVLIAVAVFSGSLPLRPAGAVGGEMVIRSAGGSQTIPMQSSEVELQVTGMLVHGKTTQTFVNTTDRVIEAVYRFPLPERATIHAMEMRIGSRRIVSVVREKEEANRIYQTAKAEGNKAAKVEQDRPNLFTTSAANINPGETVVVVLEYLQELEWEDGRFRLVYPLTFTPRFGDAVSVESNRAVREGWTAPDVKLTVRLDSGLPLDEVDSRSHVISSRWEGSNLVVESPGDGLAADRDFILEWSPAAADLPGMASFVEPRDDGRYAMFMVVPPAVGSSEAGGMPTDTLFILDISSSMQGPSIAAARRSLQTFLRSLNGGDRFRILLFNNDTHWLVRERLYADGPIVEEICGIVRRLEATGGTDIAGALAEGLAVISGNEDEAHRRIVFLTDGAVSNEDQLFRQITSSLGAVRLHVLGIGAAPNRYLMRKIAGFGRGVCSFIPDSSDVEPRIQRFLERLTRPVMADLKLEWPGCQVEAYPSRLPDLYQGQPMFISAKLPDSCDPGVVPGLRGRLLEGEIEIPAVEGEGPATGVGTRWARARIDQLMDSRFEGVAEDQVRSQVIDVALGFGLVTRYTSMVAVEEFASSEGDSETCAVRSMPPAGSRGDHFLGQGGTARPLFRLLGVGLLLLGGAGWLITRMR